MTCDTILNIMIILIKMHNFFILIEYQDLLLKKKTVNCLQSAKYISPLINDNFYLLIEKCILFMTTGLQKS